MKRVETLNVDECKFGW